MQPAAVVVMGVSGAGKTTVGKALASRLGWVFQEGDDFHPAANVAKMKAGIALDDADRAPWLTAIGAWIDGEADRGEACVVSCSALKRAYRDALRSGRPQVRFVYLRGARDVIAARIAGRHHAYFPAELLDSQFADLEEPTGETGVITVDIGPSVDRLVGEIVRRLGPSSGPVSSDQPQLPL